MQNDRLVVVGDPGSGKTTFLRRVAHALCQTELGEDPAAARTVWESPTGLFPSCPAERLAQHLAMERHPCPPPGSPMRRLGCRITGRGQSRTTAGAWTRLLPSATGSRPVYGPAGRAGRSPGSRGAGTHLAADPKRRADLRRLPFRGDQPARRPTRARPCCRALPTPGSTRCRTRRWRRS